jgi:hypothetical protein
MGEGMDTCQTCGCSCVIAITGEVGDLFGMIWPGGKEQKGYVPPHDLIGLRENNASNDYLNFHLCLVCGQVQGDWPTKAGRSHLEKYAEDQEFELACRRAYGCFNQCHWDTYTVTAKTPQEAVAKLSSQLQGDFIRIVLIQELVE